MSGSVVRALGYARVRTDERMHTGAGIAAQRATITAACRDRGWDLLDIVEDVGFSEKDLRRPAVRGALATLDRGDADCMVVAKLDRLSRSLMDFASRAACIVATPVRLSPRGEGLGARSGRATDRMYGDGTSHEEISRYLNARGLRGRVGAPWKGYRVKRMLRTADLVGRPTHEIKPERKTRRIHPLPYGYRPRGGVLVEDPDQQAVHQAYARPLHARHGPAPDRAPTDRGGRSEPAQRQSLGPLHRRALPDWLRGYARAHALPNRRNRCPSAWRRRGRGRRRTDTARSWTGWYPTAPSSA